MEDRFIQSKWSEQVAKKGVNWKELRALSATPEAWKDIGKGELVLPRETRTPNLAWVVPLFRPLERAGLKRLGFV